MLFGLDPLQATQYLFSCELIRVHLMQVQPFDGNGLEILLVFIELFILTHKSIQVLQLVTK